MLVFIEKSVDSAGCPMLGFVIRELHSENTVSMPGNVSNDSAY